MILYINGSPRVSKSNSNTFLKDIDAINIKYLYKDSFKVISKNINNVNTLIFCFPLYVDGPPYKVIEFMEYIKEYNISKDINHKDKKKEQEYLYYC